MALGRAVTFTVALSLFAVIAAGGDEPPAKAKLPPESVFRLADANRDGKLSRDEFSAFVARFPRLKDNADRARLLFTRIDSNGDGSLSTEEFRRIGDGGSLIGTRPGKAKAKANERSIPALQEKPATTEQLAFFEKKVRPVLAANCYQCHSEAKGKVKGGLVLDTKEGIRRGGNTGPAVVPGDPKASLLVSAVKYERDQLQMPPKQKLSDAAIADLEAWIAAGAVDPRDGNTSAAAPASEIDVAKGKQFWSFQKPKASIVPAVKDTAWPATDIDRFLLAAMEAKQLHPVADAEPLALLRRVTFDLTGLPPTPDDATAFAAVPTPEAYAAYVDKLLASPAFGERWGRHWLDVARYGESSGKQVNLNYPHAWRYRDYVIAAFNADKPFDQFVCEQIAGDLLPASDDKQKAERIVATGFLAIGPKAHNERNRLQFEMDLVDEQIDAVTQAFLGVTVACARCHDHKFDPIGMRDYYALAGIFRSTETCFGTVRVVQNAHPSALVSLPSGAGAATAIEPLSKSERDRLEKQVRDLREERTESIKSRGIKGNPRTLVLSTQLAQAESRLAAFETDGTPKRLAMAVRDRGRTIDSPVFVRGEVDQPSETVRRGLVRVLSDTPVSIRTGSGRKELADWIASTDNPLTARVFVNRVWLHLFGRGLVPTPDNFGNAGRPPSHPELLDTLAVRFVHEGWSVKKLVRQLVLSRAYRLSSDIDEKCYDMDPDNTFVWRMAPRRLDAEAIRDAMLAASGRLDLTPPIGSPVAMIGEGNILLMQRRQRSANDQGDATHRSVYLPIVRDSLPEPLALFDFAEPSLIVAERSTTTVPAQGLYLLNSPFAIHTAEAFADRLMKLPADDDRVVLGYQLAYGRPPTESELASAREYVTRYLDAVKNRRTTQRGQRDAWASFGQALFASAEFLYVH